jgi:MFS transporter, DHA1 family, multidrug resistance protein
MGRATSAPSGDRGFRLSLIVAALAMLAPFSVDTYLPSFPDIAHGLGAAEWQLQQTLSLYLLAFGAMTLVYGPLSDAFGRRRVVLTALALYTLSSVGCALAANIHWLLAMRIGQGLTASAAIVIGRAIVRDAFSGARAQKVMSQVTLLFGVAPILGGYLHEAYGWCSVFWLLAGLGAWLCFWVAALLPETHSGTRQSAHPRAVALAYWRAFRQVGFVLLVLSVALNFGAMFLYVAGSPVLLYRHLGLGPDQFGYLFVPLVAGVMCGAFTSGRLAGRCTHQQAVVIGFAVMLAAAAVNVAAALWLAPGFWTVVAPVAVYAVGMSIAMPNLSLLALECLPNRRGLAAAVQSFVQTAFLALVAAVASSLAARVGSLAAGMLALAAVSLLLWVGYRRRPAALAHHGDMAA